MAFKLGRRSMERLYGVKPQLARVVEKAIELTTVDFTVLQGLRTVEEQRELVARGASQTMNSKHLVGEAVDIAPFVHGAVSFHWSDYYPMALAMKQAAEAYRVEIVWGGVWDRKMSELKRDMIVEVGDYVARRKKMGRSAFLDGPHFQL
jgi:peptidoglycan LD-endopeptidase CwlK